MISILIVLRFKEDNEGNIRSRLKISFTSFHLHKQSQRYDILPKEN